MNKKRAYLKEENLLTLFSQNNFIIPEIQREYVWGENENVIVKFLTDLKQKIGLACSHCHLPSSGKKMNIGFLYTYKPDYVKIEHERFLDENLIDGQQRLTTLFLLLFFSSLKEDRKQEFLTLIRFEDKLKMSFDFKVRDLTRRFLLELVEKVDTLDELQKVTNYTWFLKDYKNDVSIKSILKALKFINQVFNDEVKYFSHIINYVVFWHFKTEVTSQGEELYITMNARGEQLADNEITKAALMMHDSQIVQWGSKWEKWQQFFWKHRNKKEKNSNADKGFNAFIFCISGLEYYLHKSEGRQAEKRIERLIDLGKIETYITAFDKLLSLKDSFATNYTYSAWIDQCISLIWKIINEEEIDWFVDYLDKNKSTERNRMVFMWSWLYYLTQNDHLGNVNADDVFRMLRFFYVRYHNFNRSVSTLKKTLDLIITNGILDSTNNQVSDEDNSLGEEIDETDINFKTKEEAIKYSFLEQYIGQPILRQFEALIWQIEDHPLNLDGSDVGNINISHLVDLNSLNSVSDLAVVRNTFNSVFPNGTKNGSAILKSTLLFYGNFFRDTTYYNKRYDFSEWKRNIRKREFREFIADLIGKDINQLIKEKKSEFLMENQTEISSRQTCLSGGKSLVQRLIFYSLLLDPHELWECGERIIICDSVIGTRLFEDETEIIYNSKGTVKTIKDLWEAVQNKYADPISEIKSQVQNQMAVKA